MIAQVHIDSIDPDKDQPRKSFTDDSISELADSIEANGLLQPITVRPVGGRFIIVMGERRWRAHRLLHSRDRRFATIECYIVDDVSISKADLLCRQIVENVQREEMPILEEAHAFGELIKMGMTEEGIAIKLGLAEFRVRWRLQLLNLSRDVRKLVAAGHLDKQQAMEVSRLENHSDQTKIIRLINAGKLSGWKATRNAVEAIINDMSQADIFGHCLPSREHLRTIKSMEDKIGQVIRVVGDGWKNGECVIAAGTNPDRCSRMADQLDHLRKTLGLMERQLRQKAAQGYMVLGDNKCA